MGDAANRIVRKLWSYCNVLRDAGLSCLDYLEQLTFLLFLNMADERERLTSERQPIWRSARDRSSDARKERRAAGHPPMASFP